MLYPPELRARPPFDCSLQTESGEVSLIGKCGDFPVEFTLPGAVLRLPQIFQQLHFGGLLPDSLQFHCKLLLRLNPVFLQLFQLASGPRRISIECHKGRIRWTPGDLNPAFCYFFRLAFCAP